jgi:hypothetical protein
MAGIGMGGATTTFDGGTMNTRVTAGAQADAYGGGGGYDPYEFVKKLRADKERSRREGVMWDEGRAERAEGMRGGMASEGNSWNDQMAPYQAAAAGESLMRSQKIRDMLTTKTSLDSMEDPFNQGYNYGTNRNFKNMPAASAMHGVNLPRSGFEVMADLAGKGKLPPGAASDQAEAYQRMPNLAPGGGLY